jgi:flagellar biosynthesis protein FlhB
VSETAGEKTFAPSAKRKTDAAQKGDVLRSRELSVAVTMLVGALWLKYAGPWLLGIFGQALRAGFTWDRAAIDQFAPQQIMLGLLALALPPVFMLGGLVLAAGLASQMGFGEGRWVGGNLMPKASRLDPMAGLKRMFGPQGWIEIAKGIAKITLLGGIAWFWARSHLAALFGLGRGELAADLAQAWDAITALLLLLAIGLGVIAAIDFPVQLLRRLGRLKMSHQDMRDEHKEAEGSPENKAAIRQRQRQIAMGGVAAAMREAQFVITNPAHFAVAMAYDPLKASAPIVLAKGKGEKALAMRELAAELELPCLEFPALARSVYYTTRERQVIREELYAAVASVLAFVFSLKRGEPIARPYIDVPLLLRFDADGRREARVES